MSWVLIVIIAALAAYVLLVGVLVVLGRREAARAVAGFIPDCIVLVRRLLGDPRVPRRHRIALWLLIGYLALPIDLVPDVIPIAGQLDDVPGRGVAPRDSPDRQVPLAIRGVTFIVGPMNETYEVVVIGGGAAGLSGALTLGRARRRVLVVDAGEPRNAPADGVHGFLTRDGTPPEELLALGRAEVARYGVEVVDGRVVSAVRDGDAFTVALADGRSERARRVLLTTGLVDELPDVPGVREGWGADVVHCPFCHGWEIRERAIGVLATGPMAVHQALLFRGWTDDLTFLAHTRGLPPAEELEQLAANGVRVVEGEVAAIERRDGRITGARLADGDVVPLEAITVQPRFVAREDLLTGLGLSAAPHPMGPEVGSQIPSDAMGRTDVPGIWVAGNARDVTASVSGAVDTGMRAAGALLADLLAEDTQRAMERAAA